ncbi:MAG: hypothetical protein JW395_1811 [Nitrospira sp.]|nr:hypothetical protein [Nitrospira sp.]
MADNPLQLAQALQSMGSPVEDDFQTGIRATDWYKSFLDRFGEEPNLNAPEYDYRKAWAAGIRPEPDPYDQNFPHWPSALPNGDMLKSADHFTAWKEHFMRAFGTNPDSMDPAAVDAARKMGGF